MGRKGFRLGGWKQIIRNNEEGKPLCPLCGEEDSEGHLLFLCTEVSEARGKYFGKLTREEVWGIMEGGERVKREDVKAVGQYMARAREERWKELGEKPG